MNFMHKTSGSILWGVLLRGAVVILLSLFVVVYLGYRHLWYFFIFVFWFVVVYPAYKQYLKFETIKEELEFGTACGKCQHFIADSHLCAMYDAHITTAEEGVPCNGIAWEAKHDDI